MSLRTNLTVLVVVVVGCAPVWAATVTGSFTYDGVPVDTVFGDITRAMVRTYDYDTYETVWGVVDLGAGTFRIEDVPPGENVLVQIELDRSQPSDDDGFDGGDLNGLEVITIASPSDDHDVEVEMQSVVHFTSPIDSMSTMSGPFNSCPVGDPIASPAMVSWDDVPRAMTYDVYVRRERCDHSIISQAHSQRSTTAFSVTLGTESEDHVSIRVECTGNVSTNLCTMPYVFMQDSIVQAYVFRGDTVVAGRGTDHGDGYFVPAVARTSGVGTSYWSTAVTVVNNEPGQQNVEIVYTPQDGDGWTDYDSTTVTIAAGEARTWSDVLDDLFSTTGAGSLEVRGSKLVVSSRTSTPADGGGSYGLGVPPLAAGDLLSYLGTSSATAGGVREVPGQWRTNFGVCEVSGKTVQVRVTVLDEHSVSLGSRVIDLGPYENTQITRVVRALTSSNQLDNGIIRVEVTGATGKVGAYLTIIDEETNDSTYVVIAPQEPTAG